MRSLRCQAGRQFIQDSKRCKMIIIEAVQMVIRGECSTGSTGSIGREYRQYK